MNAQAGALTLEEARAALQAAEDAHRPLAEALDAAEADAATLAAELTQAQRQGVNSRQALGVAQSEKHARERARDLDGQVAASWVRVKAARRAVDAAELAATVPSLAEEEGAAEAELRREYAEACRFAMAVVAQGAPKLARLQAAMAAADAAQRATAEARGQRVFTRTSERVRPEYPHVFFVLNALAGAHSAGQG